MAMEIDEAVIRVDNCADIEGAEPIEISEDEARRVRLYENFYQVNSIDPECYRTYDVKRIRSAQRRWDRRAGGHDQRVQRARLCGVRRREDAGRGKPVPARLQYL